jgi:hypothetical protein
MGAITIVPVRPFSRSLSGVSLSGSGGAPVGSTATAVVEGDIIHR